MKRPAEPARTPPLTSARRLAKKATDAIKARQLAIASVVQHASAHAEAPATASMPPARRPCRFQNRQRPSSRVRPQQQATAARRAKSGRR